MSVQGGAQLPRDLASDFAYQEVHACRLQARTNLYGLTIIEDVAADGKRTTHFLVGTHSTDNIKVVCVSVSDSRWSTQEIAFNYIPLDAEVISIDSFQRDGMFIVGVTLVKSVANQPDVFFLNVYGASIAASGKKKRPFDLAALASDCQPISIGYAPFQLTHMAVTDALTGEISMAFVASGSDGRLHLYREDRASHEFFEQPIADHFPALDRLPPSKTTCLALHSTEDGGRLIALGGQDGTLTLISIPVEAADADATTLSVVLDGTISFVSFFSDTRDDFAVPASLAPYLKIDEPQQPQQLHLLVGSALDGAFVYHDVRREGLAACSRLPHSDAFDIVVCGHVAHGHGAGAPEIFVGTYGQELLVYKPAAAAAREYELVARRAFVAPLYQLRSCDVTGDGLDELVVLTLTGVHFLQPDLTAARQRVLKALAAMQDISRMQKQLKLGA